MGLNKQSLCLLMASHHKLPERLTVHSATSVRSSCTLDNGPGSLLPAGSVFSVLLDEDSADIPAGMFIAILQKDSRLSAFVLT